MKLPDYLIDKVHEISSRMENVKASNDKRSMSLIEISFLRSSSLKVVKI